MYKIFQNGTALTAEAVNDYFMEQSVSTFADASERDNTIPAPNAGQHCYLLRTKRTYYYDATAGWVELLGSNVSGLTARQTLVCTSTTRPSHAAGRIIFETDSDRTMISDGNGWQKIAGPVVRTSFVDSTSVVTAAAGAATQVFNGTFTAAFGGEFTLYGSTGYASAAAAAFTVKLHLDGVLVAESRMQNRSTGYNIYFPISLTGRIYADAGSHTASLSLTPDGGSASITSRDQYLQVHV